MEENNVQRSNNIAAVILTRKAFAGLRIVKQKTTC